MVLESVSKFLQEYMLPYILSILGEKSFLGQLIANNPLLLFVIIVLPILAIWMIALFVDFVKDSWKMPIGVIFDIFAILLFPTVPYVLFGLAIAAGILYYFLANGSPVQNGIYAGLGAMRFLIIAPLIPVPESLKVLLVLVPVCTIITLFLCITD